MTCVEIFCYAIIRVILRTYFFSLRWFCEITSIGEEMMSLSLDSQSPTLTLVSSTGGRIELRFLEGRSRALRSSKLRKYVISAVVGMKVNQ